MAGKQRPAWLRLLTTLLTTLAATGAACPPAWAEQTEFEVYRTELPDAGESNFDFASSLSKTPNQGDSNGRSMFQAIGEYSYGIADRWAAGFRLPVYQTGGTWRGYGLLGEVKYVAPHVEQGFYWGAEIEAGYVSPPGEARQWLLEVMPIAGYRLERWEFTVNPGVVVASAGDGRGVVTFEPNGKISRQVAPQSAIGLEYFVDAGPLRAILPRAARSEVAYLALDTKLGKCGVNIGLGRGMTDASPRWTAKLVADLEFD